ncbi:MAG: PIN domain-containing protein [Pseudomonadota bacterium]
MPLTVVDTSFLVALFNRSDRRFVAAEAFMQKSSDEFVTNGAVLAEVSHLLEGVGTAAIDCIVWVDQAFVFDDQTGGDLPRIAELMTKYADLPADFTDASLVALAERRDTTRVATFDSDFSVYRFRGRRKFEIVPGF